MQADITIGCDNDPYFNTTDDRKNSFFDINKIDPDVYYRALARPCGHDRKPGKYISINRTSNISYKTGTIIHELGHTLGFNTPIQMMEFK